MKLFPKNNHFKVTMYGNTIIGGWPFFCEDHPILRRVYKIHGYITLTVFATFCTSTLVEGCRLMSLEEVQMQKIFENLCISLLYAIILMKAFVVRTPKMVGLIREVIKLENSMYDSKDEDVIKIYDTHVSQIRKTHIIFIINCVCVAASYFIVPFLSATVTFDETTNKTIIERSLPTSAWVPWDEKDNYWATYMWHLYGAGTSASNVMFMDVFMFGFITFPLGQIDILSHSLRNSKRYVFDVQKQVGCSLEEASFILFRKYVLQHKDIIRYVNVFNESVRLVMVFDFLVSSLQLAAIAIQLVGSDFDPIDLLFWGTFALCMLLRLFLYYWYANEIMEKSANISNAIWESNWFEQPYKVKQLMLIMMMRSQRVLGLDIGPFSKMTLESFVGIVKGAYSYVTVMYR